jgi:hypothetical protein
MSEFLRVIVCILFHARHHKHVFIEGYGRDDYGHTVECAKCLAAQSGPGA